eukprot:gnl/Dysnectes_brevis/2970_a3657_811.p2 GENE.gnl/Dysnectes_brevis/2970_a3657_811~~gnl/Dysnectes_brevis/2970_a3657_811.p2  ORF type:complete len:250 (-),score=95.39 gnl/Dysnectes_brevis/2970_a3657_811:100-849(-)
MSNQTVSYKLGSNVYEVITKRDAAFKFRENQAMSVDSVIITSDIFSDAKKGDRCSDAQIAELGPDPIRTILLKGHVVLSTVERRARVAERTNEVIAWISQNYIDKDRRALPPIRVKGAVEQLKALRIDPFESAAIQGQKTADRIIKSGVLFMAPGGLGGQATVPYTHVGGVQGAIHGLGVHLDGDGDYNADGWTFRFTCSPSALDTLVAMLESQCKGEFQLHLDSDSAPAVSAPKKKGKKKGKKKRGKK